jgi:hypothetical protein
LWRGFVYVVGGAVCKLEWSGASAKNLSRACVLVQSWTAIEMKKVAVVTLGIYYWFIPVDWHVLIKSIDYEYFIMWLVVARIAFFTW